MIASAVDFSLFGEFEELVLLSLEQRKLGVRFQSIEGFDEFGNIKLDSTIL